MELYRYYDQIYSECSIDPGGCETYFTTDPRIELSTFKVIKETPCGYWITSGFSLSSPKRWVSKTGRKRYALETKELALESFRRRKLKQVGIYTARLHNAKYALEQAEKMISTASLVSTES